jgi:Lon protease-like protein
VPSDDPELDLSAVPLFPLPGVVLFPRAVLPLHIFEDRYRAMTADVLEGNKLIAMALLRPGWEKSYYNMSYSGRPEIEPVVCVGRILSHEMLADGKYNFLLQGVRRASIVREIADEPAGKPGAKPYRVARLQPLVEVPALEIDLESHRQRLSAVFARRPIAATGAGRQFQKMTASHLPTSDIADLAAFTFLDGVPIKQSLLADCDVRRRVERTIAALEAIAQAAAQSLEKPPAPQILFPPDPTVN